MAIGVLILGESGTGKTYSIHGFSPDEVKILSVKKPILPFKGNYEIVRTPDGDSIIDELHNTNKKAIVIDDFQYILGVPMLRRIGEKGWDKFNEIQQPYADVLEELDKLPDDVIVYLNSHIESDDTGKRKIKTIGKALDKYLTVEGLFLIVFGTLVVDGKYYFTTQNNGNDTVKTPYGMFETYAIDNDLKYVDTKIRNYYEIGEYAPDEQIKEMDAAHVAPEVEKPDADGRKRRRKARNNEKENDSEKKPEETPKENEKEESAEKPKRRRKSRESVAETAENVADTPENVASEEKPKRRRKKREPAVTDDIPDSFELQEDDIPF